MIDLVGINSHQIKNRSEQILNAEGMSCGKTGRSITGTDYGCPIEYGPPDFHAYVEVYLADRWYIFDPPGLTIPMGLVRFGTGRDAADVAFATIFGGVTSAAPVIRATAVTDGTNNSVMPHFHQGALSTDHGA